MAKEDNVVTGALALIKSGGRVIGKMKSIRYSENIRRLRVGGIGTILPQEQPPVEWDGTLSCDFMNIDLKQSSIPGALNREFDNARSQVLEGGTSFEDNLLLECCREPVQVDIFKKVCDVVDENGNVKPKLQPIAIITSLLIDTDGFDITEGAISGRQQSFKCNNPLIQPKYLS